VATGAAAALGEVFGFEAFSAHPRRQASATRPNEAEAGRRMELRSYHGHVASRPDDTIVNRSPR